jgi:hypothetical protein
MDDYNKSGNPQDIQNVIAWLWHHSPYCQAWKISPAIAPYVAQMGEPVLDPISK